MATNKADKQAAERAEAKKGKRAAEQAETGKKAKKSADEQETRQLTLDEEVEQSVDEKIAHMQQAARARKRVRIPLFTYGLRWHNALIYIFMWLAAFYYFHNAWRYATGSQNGPNQQQIYAFFGAGARSVDIIYALLMAALGGYIIYARFHLARLKKKSTLHLSIICVASVLLRLGYYCAYYVAISQTAALGVRLMELDIVSWSLGWMLIMVLNIGYYGARWRLFKN